MASRSSKSIVELIEELEKENQSLQALKKAFNMAVKAEFGYETKELHEIIAKEKALEKKFAGMQTNHHGEAMM